VVPALDEALAGAKIGDVLSFSAAAGDSGELTFRVLVKEVKEKKLPTLDDEWAAESSEFPTVADLRSDLRGRVERVKVLQTRMAQREQALGALVDLVDDDEVPEVLVEEEVRQRVHDLRHRLEEQRIGIEDFLKATGRTGDDLVAQVRTEALRSVKADLALRSLAEAEDLQVTDEEMEAELDAMAVRMELDPKELRRQLDRTGRTAAVRSEQRKSKAHTWLLDHVAMVDEEGKSISHEDMAALAPSLLAESGSGGAGTTDDTTGDTAVGDEATNRKTEGAER
jgi:trigger factor